MDKQITNSMNLARILKYASMFTTNDGIYSHFYFLENAVITTDGSFLFKSNIDGLLVSTLPAKKVMQFLSVCPSENINCSYNGAEKTSVVFTSASYKTEIPNTYVSEIPSPKELFGEPITKINKSKKKTEIKITSKLIEALGKVSFCKVAASDAGKQELSGVRIEKEGVFTTDSYGIASVLMDTGIEQPFTLPNKLADFIVQYGIEPEACFITSDYIIIKYSNISIIGLLKNFPYPAISKRITEFVPTYTIKLEDSEQIKTSTLKRLTTSDGAAIQVAPIDSNTVELSITDLLGYKTSEKVLAQNSLEKSFITGFKYFKDGYKHTDEIQVYCNGGDSVQLMFLKDSFKYTLLGKIA